LKNRTESSGQGQCLAVSMYASSLVSCLISSCVYSKYLILTILTILLGCYSRHMKLLHFKRISAFLLTQKIRSLIFPFIAKLTDNLRWNLNYSYWRVYVIVNVQ